jgi:hypothetical protein
LILTEQAKEKPSVGTVCYLSFYLSNLAVLVFIIFLVQQSHNDVKLQHHKAMVQQLHNVVKPEHRKA